MAEAKTRTNKKQGQTALPFKDKRKNVLLKGIDTLK